MGSEFVSLWNVLVGSLAEDLFPWFSCFFLFPLGNVDREFYGFTPLILCGAK